MVVKNRPLSVRLNGLSDVRIGIEVREIVRGVDCDLLEISMFGCNGLEGRDDPYDGRRLGPKNCISLCHFERATDAKLELPTKGGKLWFQYTETNVQGFEGISAPHYQLHYPSKVFHVVPREQDLSEV